MIVAGYVFLCKRVSCFLLALFIIVSIMDIGSPEVSACQIESSQIESSQIASNEIESNFPASVGTSNVNTNWRLERVALDDEFFVQVSALELWCRENGLTDQADQLVQLAKPRDLNRQIVFVPSERSGRKAKEGLLGQFEQRREELMAWQAERVFELASSAAKVEAGQAAIQLLNEVLFFAPDHALIRKILGHRKSDDGWHLYSDRLKIRTAGNPHAITGWPAGRYLTASSANFEIASNAPEDQLRDLAEKLERWHYIWRQAFFSYWGNPRSVQRWIAGSGSFSYSRKKYKIVFFANRAGYLTALASLGPIVQQSYGYYSNARNTSFFYFDADSSIESTWRHELTHQLFRESIGAAQNLRTFEEQLIWLDEGMATYFESLVDHGAYVTLGGFDASRVQHARLRFFRTGFQLPFEELSSLGRLELQARDDVVALYSQMAAQMDMLINDHQGADEMSVMRLLEMAYRGRTIREGSIEEVLGRSFEELDQRYPEFLRVDRDQINRFLSANDSRTELSFPYAGLDTTSFQQIGKCKNLNWLDISGNLISASDLAHLRDCQSLVQIILKGCQLEPGCLANLCQLPELIELDLSDSNVDDAMLFELANCEKLQRIYLLRTKVTPAAAIRLQQAIPSLEILQ